MYEYTRQLALARSIEDVWDLHCRTMAGFGFDRIIYGMTRATGANSALGAFEDAFVLSNHGESYDEAFIGSQMFLEAPGFLWSQENTGAIGWGALWTDNPSLTARDREIIAFQRAHDVIAGYTVCITQSCARTFAVASLTARRGLSQSDVDGIWAADGGRIWTMNNLMHLKILCLPHRRTPQVLSVRQREALEWVGDGKSYQDIAEIMGVSMATVEKHLRLAREKLRVTTTSQAVLKAAFQNQLYTVGDTGLSVSNRRQGAMTSPGAPPIQTLSKM